MNSQGQVSLSNLLNAFCAANVPVNSYQLANNLGESNQSNYSMSSVNNAISRLGLNQNQLNAVRQSLGNGSVNPNSNSVAASPQWWNTAPNNQGWSTGNGTATMANGQTLNYGGQLNSNLSNANNQTLNSGKLYLDSQLNSGSLSSNSSTCNGSLMANGNAQPSGSDWVVVMNSDTFLQLAKSGAMQL